ncbi:hypothetical protein J7L49_00105 [Candidatus Bathyarchaeota archaeon]|nr:hypothetical protein [Candidatus Bathyarchaeota archaeon]
MSGKIREKIINSILSCNPQISREEILKRLEEEKEKTGGFIDEETLLRMIASELNVKISREIKPLRTSTLDLVPGLNDVTVAGRVIAVFPPRTFRKGKGGKMASVLIADKEGVLRVILWNEKTEIIENGKVKAGQLVRFSHAYTREGMDGKVELNVGERSNVEVNPNDLKDEEYPTIENFSTKIAYINNKVKKVNVFGKVKDILSESSFKRKDGSAGKVLKFLLVDDTGEIPVVVWNEKVDEVRNYLKRNGRIQIVNAKVKKSSIGKVEIHVNSKTYIQALKNEEFMKISDLKAGLRNISVRGKVVAKPLLREVKTSRGERVKLAVFELEDDAGRVWVSAWRSHADSVKNLKKGDGIILKKVYVKKGFGDQLEISTTRKTQIISLDADDQ